MGVSARMLNAARSWAHRSLAALIASTKTDVPPSTRFLMQCSSCRCGGCCMYLHIIRPAYQPINQTHMRSICKSRFKSVYAIFVLPL
jgi:hypothetical protein